MKIIRNKGIKFVPASHENPLKPGSWKKVLFIKKDITLDKNLQMINWAMIKPGKSFNPHYHEDLDEIFIIVSGRADIISARKRDTLDRGDAVFIPKGEVHKMSNRGSEDLVYLAIGFSEGKGGKTVLV